eukprot:CAMPEP_0118818688 /NCGR_PEP_ID=MMETSP1162-20130426/6359_1 /TAXON_ID=33656 /ORGANISM="Phaeocystis Sp, Strain CCMP2710" /LENGTH=283 /DNA_ID=CAMNT_0006748909 /DNA_START=83 /DNA_END=934 /DNA_ORIENTATION=-
MSLLAPPVVVLGPGSLDLRLLTAKLAARAGLQTSLFSPSGSVQDIWLEQMYGVEDGSTDISTSAEPLRPAMVADADAREAALAAAEGLALISDGVAMPESALSSVLAVASQLKRIVCLSKMGVTRATAGPLGLGKDAVNQLEAEERLKAACAKADIELAIVRVGTLKGGGPGRADNGIDAGLARPYYDNVMDIETLRVTQAYDKVTLGAKCVKGDPVDMSNAFQRQLRKGSFEPFEDETSRVSACAAVVAALRHPSPLEFSVSAAKAEAAPTSGQWEAMLNRL